MDESKLNLAQKMVKIREQVVYLKKEKSGYQYKYVAGSQVLSAIRATMDSLNVLVTPNIKSTSMETIGAGDKKPDYLCSLEMSMVWTDGDSGEMIEIPWYATAKQNDPARAYGSALTYALRYHLLNVLLVPTDELDPDVYEAKAHPELQVISKDDRMKLLATMEKCNLSGEDAKRIIKTKGYGKSTEIMAKDFDAIIELMIQSKKSATKPSETKGKKEVDRK